MKRCFILFLLAALLAASFTGCGTVGEIAGNVADAAVKELETQVKDKLEENKLRVVELKTVFGKLNDGGSDYQVFIAALVRSESTAVPQATADTLAKVFTEAGLMTQSESSLQSPYLIHKTITFQHSDFSEGGYYVIYAYHNDLAAGLPSLKG